MPFPMKIQPIDIDSEPVRFDSAAKPVFKSRFRRLFDRSVLKISSAEKPTSGAGEKDAAEFEPSSVCLAKMVQNFMEETNEKPQQPATKCGRNRCNCFNGNNDSSDDELDVFFGDSNTGGSFGGDASDILKSLIPCVSVVERNLLADTAKIVEANKNLNKQKDELRKIVTDGLSSLGYDSSVCKSKWDKSSSYPAGEYEYIDVITEGDRLLIDIDFRSEFEVARPTGAYKAVLQSLPFIFVGKPDRLGQIVSIVSEAARQSLKKKGMPFPPWRKAEYVRAKWLSPCITRTTTQKNKTQQNDAVSSSAAAGEEAQKTLISDEMCEFGELDLIFGESEAADSAAPSPATGNRVEPAKVTGNSAWQPPAIKPKSIERGARIVTGLASLLKEKP